MATLSRNHWKCLSVFLMTIMAIGILTPTAFAASPTLEQAIKVVLGIKAKVDKLPSDPASQSKIGNTKAITNWFSQQLGDGEIFSNFQLLGEDLDGKNRSGHISIYSWPSSTPAPELTLYCGISVNEHTGMNGIIVNSIDGTINTSFSCTSVSLYIQDIPDGENPEENVIIDIQYTETGKLTLGAVE